MTAFLALVKKDLQIFFGDGRAVLMAFLAPILIGSFFGFVFAPKPARELSKMAVLVVDNDQSATTLDLLASLQKDAALAVSKSELEPAREAVKKGKVPVALVLPKGFGEQAAVSLFRAAEKPEITVLFDPSRQMEASMVRGILTGQVMQAVTKSGFGASALRSLDTDTMDPAIKGELQALLRSVDKLNARPQRQGEGGIAVPFTTREEALTSGTGVVYNAYAHSFGGMAIQFMLFMGIDVGIGVLLLRQRGLLHRFRAAPISKATLLGSRAASAMLIGMLILAVVFAYARLVFNVRIEGSFAGFVVICAAFSLMTAAYGLLIAALGKTPEAARGIATLATLLMVMCSGAWVPSFVFPQWMQLLTKAIPVRWAMDGMDAMTWRGLGFDEAILPAGVLLGSAAVFGAIAVWRFRWNAE
jgi:ABC-2 type transport system permease protein